MNPQMSTPLDSHKYPNYIHTYIIPSPDPLLYLISHPEVSLGLMSRLTLSSMTQFVCAIDFLQAGYGDRWATLSRVTAPDAQPILYAAQKYAVLLSFFGVANQTGGFPPIVSKLERPPFPQGVDRFS